MFVISVAAKEMNAVGIRSRIEIALKANATGKPYRSAQHGGSLQATLVGVRLTEKLGWYT